MERERRTGADRVRVPDRYPVHLAPADLAGLGDAVEDVAADLADAALLFARGHGFTLAARPTVELVADPRSASGDIRVAATFEPVDLPDVDRRRGRPDDGLRGARAARAGRPSCARSGATAASARSRSTGRC